MASTARVRAPELDGAGGFIGTAGPLTLASLRGRIVLLDFFTQSCINCVHVLDELRDLERQFGDDLLVIGTHSPKFPHEHDHESVVRAVERFGITHPVLDDPELRSWSAYAVSAWPTLVLIDPEGYIAQQVSGEGHAGYLAQGIATLLDAHGAKGSLVRGPLPVVPPDPPPRTGLRYPGKVAHDPERGLLAVADTGHHRIVLLDGAGAPRRDVRGGGSAFATGRLVLAGIAVDRRRRQPPPPPRRPRDARAAHDRRAAALALGRRTVRGRHPRDRHGRDASAVGLRPELRPHGRRRR